MAANIRFIDDSSVRVFVDTTYDSEIDNVDDESDDETSDEETILKRKQHLRQQTQNNKEHIAGDVLRSISFQWIQTFQSQVIHHRSKYPGKHLI